MYHSLHEASSYHNLQRLQPSQPHQQHQQQQQSYQEDYDEWNNLRGYVALTGTAETVISSPGVAAAAPTVATTDVDMDVLSDDEEWTPPLAVSSAELVLAMMDGSYYHASYQANSHDDVHGDGDK
jgi:hypothetical protein